MLTDAGRRRRWRKVKGIPLDRGCKEALLAEEERETRAEEPLRILVAGLT
jgi:hypothetical protein